MDHPGWFTGIGLWIPDKTDIRTNDIFTEIFFRSSQAICNFKEEFDSPNDFFMKAKDQMTDGISLQSTGGLKIKRKESKLKLKIRKALTSLKTIITPKTRLETSESMINPDTTTEQGKDTVTPRKTASETL